MDPIIIHSHHSGSLYALFYFLAFLTMTAFFIINGLRNNYPFHKLWLVSVTGAIFFILGNKLFAIHPSDWKYLVIDTANVSHGAKTMLGGLLGLMIGSILVIRWLRLDARVADFAAVGLPLAMAVTRVGCLLSGCCFGKPSGLPWAVCYPDGTAAFNNHSVNGLIGLHDHISLPVHPTQAYDILTCLVIATLVWRGAKYLKARGNLLILSIALYGFARFILEFFRDPGSGLYASEIWMGLKIVQWITLGASILLTAVILTREIHQKNHTKPYRTEQEHMMRPLTLMMFLAMLAVALFGWFDPMERITVSALMASSIPVMAWLLYKTAILPGFRFHFVLILLAGFITMSQHSDNPGDRHRNFAKEQWFSIDGAYGGGSYEVVYYDCHGHVTNRFIRQTRIWSAGATYHLKTGLNHHLTAGLHLLNYSDITDETGEADYSSFGINPCISFEMRHLGAGLGLNAFFEPVRMKKVLPTAYLRAGPKDIIYADVRFMNDFYFSGYPSFFQVGIGSGFGKTDRGSGRIGFCSGESFENGGFFAAGDILIKRDVMIKFNFSYGRRFNGAAGLQWHIGKNRWGSKMANNPSTVDKK